MTTRTKLLAAALALLASAPGLLEAQNPLTINLRGAPAGTPVVAVSNGQRQAIGQADADGKVVVRSDALVGKGKRVNVKLDPRGSQPQVVLVPEGEKDPDCADSQQRSNDPCIPLGFWIGGQASAVTLNFTGAGTPTFETFETGTPGLPKRPYFVPGSIKFGLTFDMNYFHGFEKTLGDQPDIVDFSGENGNFGGGAFIEYQLPIRHSISFGLSAHYGVQDFEQTYNSSNPLVPQRVEGKVGGFFARTYGTYWTTYGPLNVGGRAGLSWTRDKLDLSSYYTLDQLREDTRSLTGFKATFGIAGDFHLMRGIHGRVAGDYITSFKGNDADAHVKGSVGVYHVIRSF